MPYLIVTAPSGSMTAAPAFSPAPGTYTSNQTVTLSDSTSGATIYYTTDGTTPTTASTVYSTPIAVTTTTTIKAIAIATGQTQSVLVSGTYTINIPTAAATPTFSPAAGSYTGTQSVTIACATSGATIYYTTDGTTPTTSSTQYTGALSITTTTTVKAIATATGYTQSGVGTATYTISTPRAATPTFSPSPGTYTSNQSVTLSDATSGATIYYTTDGSTPTTSSTQYTAAISVTTTTTINAIASASGYLQSAVGTGVYTINIPTQAATPTFSPAPGSYTATQSVTLACATSGASIYYTTNGSTPTTSSTLYTGAISVASTTTIKAIATATGYTQSGVASGTYTISVAPTAATPVITPGTGSYKSVQSVSITTTTTTATIYYTTDGSTPPSSSTTLTYDGAFLVVAPGETVNAIAVAPGYNNSAIATANIVVNTSGYNVLGMNTSYGDVNGNLGTFPLNIMKTMGQGGSDGGQGATFYNIGCWTPQIGNTRYYDYLIQYDSDGYPTSMVANDPSGTFTGTFTSFTAGVFGSLSTPPGAALPYPQDTYTFTCDGPIDMTITGDGSATLSTTNTGTNSVSFAVTPTSRGLSFQYSIPALATGYPKNMSLVQNTYTSLYASGEIWHPLMKAMFTNFTAIRAMHMYQLDGNYMQYFFLTAAPTTAIAAGDTMQLYHIWLYPSGTWPVTMSSGQIIPVTFTGGSTTVTFTEAVTGYPTASGWTLASGSVTTLPVVDLKANAYQTGYELLITSGANAGLLAPITANTVTTITIASAYAHAFTTTNLLSGTFTGATGQGSNSLQVTGLTSNAYTQTATQTCFVHFTSGANAGVYNQIKSNNATTITVFDNVANAVAVGDTFTILTGTSYQILATTLPQMRFAKTLTPSTGTVYAYGQVACFNFATRPLVTNCSWAQWRGVPVETIAQLCNELSCDYWHNFQAFTTNADVTSYANLLKSGAGSSLAAFKGVTQSLYVECCNEVWLYEGDPNAPYCEAAGTAQFAQWKTYFTNDSEWVPRHYFLGGFTCTVAQLFKAVYGSSFASKVTVSCGAQAGNQQTVDAAINPNFQTTANPFLFLGNNGVAPGSYVSAYGVTAVNVGFYWPAYPGCLDFSGDNAVPSVTAVLTEGSATFTQSTQKTVNGVLTYVLNPCFMVGALVSGTGIATTITQSGSGTVAVTVTVIAGAGPWTITMSQAATASSPTNPGYTTIVIDPNYIVNTQSDGGHKLLVALGTQSPVDGLQFYNNNQAIPTTGYIGQAFNYNANNVVPDVTKYGNLLLLGYEGGCNFSPNAYYSTSSPQWNNNETLYQSVFRTAAKNSDCYNLYTYQLDAFSTQFALMMQFDICGPLTEFFFHVLESPMQLGDGKGTYYALSALPSSFQACQDYIGKTYAPTG